MARDSLSKHQQKVFEIALGYYDRGWCVIPLIYGSKRAEVAWKQYQRERPTRWQVEQWFCDCEDHNIGVITGKVSDGLVILVFNQKEDFKPFFDGDDILGKTPVAMSRRGPHVYLKTGEAIKSHIYAGGRFEVKGEGTYVVAPPSIHPSGKQYQWLNREITKMLFVSNFKQWVKERDLRIGIEIDSFRKPQLIATRRLYITPETTCPRWVKELVPKGERNQCAFRVACYFFKHYPRTRAEALVTRWANTFCEDFPDKSFTEEALKATINSAYKTVTGGKQ